MKALHLVKKFLKKHYVKGRPILLGFSGGGDSTALLHLLLECQKNFKVDLHLAHLDHGWREESHKEALLLQKKAKKLGVTFHCKHLTNINIKNKKNLEDVYRKERLMFFRELFKKFNYQALVLAHHKDDLAETVLKRIFEGAHLTNLSGILEVTSLEGMIVWRPLLELNKQDLLEYLQKREIAYFDDKTNYEERFLRGRIRQTLLPFIAKQFGKEVASNLSMLSFRAEELRQYLDKKTQEAFERREKSPLGVFLDFKPYFALENIEKQHLLQRLLKEERIVLSRNTLQCLLKAIFFQKKLFKLNFQNGMFLVNNGKMFILRGLRDYLSMCNSCLLKKEKML
jgi:tRNA(Ile)-lysidine synthase